MLAYGTLNCNNYQTGSPIANSPCLFIAVAGRQRSVTTFHRRRMPVILARTVLEDVWVNSSGEYSPCVLTSEKYGPMRIFSDVSTHSLLQRALGWAES